MFYCFQTAVTHCYIYFNTQARIKEIHDELEEKQKEKLKKRKEDMKRIEELEKQVADLETKCKSKKDKFKDSREVKISGSGLLTNIFLAFYTRNLCLFISVVFFHIKGKTS